MVKPEKLLNQIVIANRLRDGATVFLTATDEWSTSVDDSVIATDKGAAERLQKLADKAVADRVVVGPTLIDVTAQGGRIQPVSYRERIRAFGPTNTPHVSERLSA
jgi:hypothetical protein